MFILILLLLATPVMADENYVVNGGDVYKIETVSVDVERVNLEKELIQANAQVESYQQNILVQQAGLIKAQSWLRDVQDKLNTVNIPQTENVIYPDTSIYVQPDEAIYLDESIY